MDYESEFDEINAWLQGLTQQVNKVEFDDMPPVSFRYGKQEDCIGIEARYYRVARVIEFSPGFLASCWKDGSEFWDSSRMQGTLRHELAHAWVDWKGLWGDEAGGHNEAFLLKAHSLGLNLEATFERYPAAREIYERIFEVPGTEEPGGSSPATAYPPFKEVEEDTPWDAFGPSFVYAGS